MRYNNEIQTVHLGDISGLASFNKSPVQSPLIQKKRLSSPEKRGLPLNKTVSYDL